MMKLTCFQRGVSLSGLLSWIVVLAVVGIMVIKIAPAYVQDAAISSIFDDMVHDPEMQGASAKTIQESYRRRALMNDITAIEPGDVQIINTPGGLELSAGYSRKVPLMGNVSLLLEFNPHSSSR